MILRSHFDCEMDVTIRTRNRNGGIVQVVSKNIVVNNGRKYLRDVVSCKSYGSNSIDPPPPTRTVGERAAALAMITPWTNHRIRYVALGTGGVLQSATYPPVSGTFVEQVSTQGLERPVAVAYRPGYNPGGLGLCEYQWLKQVEPQNSAEELPDDFSAVYRAFFGYSEVSFSSQPGEYNNVVPISEILLLTSEAEAYTKAPTPAAKYVVLNRDSTVYTWPDGSTYFPGCNGDVPGAVAYNLTTPIYKTPNVTLEILWELRS